MTDEALSAGVVFDIDGTLLDTNYLHVVAWSAAFCDNGFDVNMADIHRTIGMPSDALVDRLAGTGGQELVEAHAYHFDRLRRQYGVRRMDGSHPLLARCAELGWIIVLATSAKDADLDWMLPIIDADDLIAGAVTSGEVRKGKPHPDLLLAAAASHRLATDRTIAVGDSVWDVESARHAGVRCIALTGGGIGMSELERAGADEVYENAVALIERMPLSALGARAPSRDR